MLKEDIIRNFHIEIDSKEKMNGGTSLVIRSDWANNMPEVKKIVVYLDGGNPYTGEPINREKYSYEFNGINKAHSVATGNLDGEYFLRFNAVLSDNSTLEDFQKPIPVVIGGNEKPSINYTVQKSHSGWTALEFDSNCWKRCNGKLWLKCGDHYQMLPYFSGETMSCMVPTNNIKDIRIISTDRYLPEVVKNTGK